MTPHTFYVLHQLDGSAIYGVFSDKAKAALWNYENGTYAHITEYILDQGRSQEKKQTTSCAGCGREFGPTFSAYWTEVKGNKAHYYCVSCAEKLGK